VPFLSEHFFIFAFTLLQGQFLTVVGEELPAIKAAFKKFSTTKTSYQPKLTIVICVSTFDPG